MRPSIKSEPLDQGASPYPDRLALSPKEAAAAIGVGRTFLYEAISSGGLKTIRIGARRFITIDALVAIALSRLAPPAETALRHR